MSQYNFSTLNDKELEVLTRDLLTREMSIPFQSFKMGKDKGIDLRYSTAESENQIIVQVKHYLKSGYGQLLNVLKNKEKEKIDKLSPKRYILVTSIGLSPSDKEAIKKALSPHILNTNDIYGADDLNSLIAKYGDIEKKHFKLWFSNLNIIQKIVNNGIDGRSAFIEEKIKKNTDIYVVNQTFHEAIDILRKKKVLLITGIPGIGKTSLANLITYYLLSRDFRLVYIDEKIREAEDMFDSDQNIKQLFYFDDFLGSNYLEIINSKNTENSIVNFVERIKATKNKYLILTTRSTILNQAISAHEKLSRANLDSLKYEIEIKNYSEYDKAKILYNHLYFNEIDPEMINEIFKEKNYWKIIQHINYNPRLIEYFTKEKNISHLKANNYFDFIISNLNNPEEIWESAFANQLNTSEKYLLFTLLSFGRIVTKKNLEVAYDEKIESEVAKHGFTREVNIFNISLRNLMDGYITNTIVYYSIQNSYIDFINPSLKDYLITFFNKNNSEKWRFIESFIFIEQFMYVFRKKSDAKNNIVIEDNEIRKFIEMACTKKLRSTSIQDTDNLNLRVVNFLHSYRTSDNIEFIDKMVLIRLNEINWKMITIIYIEDILPVFETIDNKSEIFKYIKSNWDIIVTKLIDRANQDIELERIKNLFEKFEVDYKDYKKEDLTWKGTLVTAVSRIFKKKADEIVELNEYKIYSDHDFEEMEENISACFEQMQATYLNDIEIEQTYNPCESIDPDSLIKENKITISEDESQTIDWESIRNEKRESDEKIDDLFSVFEK